MKTDSINSTKLNFYSSFFLGILVVLGLVVLLLKILPNFNLLVTKSCHHTGSSCQLSVPFTNPFISIPYLFLWGLGLLVILITLISLIYQIVATLRFKKSLLSRQIKPHPDLIKLSEKLGLTNKILIIKDSRVFCFCLGFVYPRIYLSSAIFSKLNLAEIEAVLLHEKYHLEHKDPLKILITQSIKRAFFFLPIFKDLGNGYIIGKELAADKKVISFLNDKGVLIDALLKILALESGFDYQGAVTGPISVNKERIEALKDSKKTKRVHISILSIIFSIIIISTLIFLGTNVSSATVDSNCSCTSDYQCSPENHTHSYGEVGHSCLMK